MIAHEYNCAPEDLGMVDDEDGDFVTLNDRKIVEVVAARSNT